MPAVACTTAAVRAQAGEGLALLGPGQVVEPLVAGVGAVDLVAHGGRVLVDLDELLQVGTVGLVVAGDEPDGELRILNARLGQARRRVESLGGDDEMGVALGNVHVPRDTGQLRAFDLDELQLLGILGDVLE